MIWTTYDNRKLLIQDIDDQHLSNIYWFQLTSSIPWMINPDILGEIKRRKITVLPWRPLPIPGELEWLRPYLRGNDIFFNNQKIGEV